MNARIEIVHDHDDVFRVTMLDPRLREQYFRSRDDALRLAMAWCMESWGRGVHVDITEYPQGSTRPRWTAPDLRCLADLQDIAESARDACRLAEAVA